MDNTHRRNFSSGAKWESIVGYSRAVRIGQTIEVAGTCAVDQEGNPYAVGDAYLQTVRVLEIIKDALAQLGGRMEDVVRTRIFVSDISLWTEVGKAHGEVFHSIRPVTTMVEVSNLISADYLVEIEATAIISPM
ncbi:MAG: RidA family protein [Saprospiraceae bacterium]|nr:RidA family protein [Saprospiraceae bacterium]